ncbi:MAG TPA: tetratricopeptide repeat protein [Steroidobacteraceae bacterium]|jgi:predicted O-linked N-acetylglucosamine transferase (SPINDLY family)|nr:tetratricopeptide repeat protein [Steroidobacteraceae bacterium]
MRPSAVAAAAPDAIQKAWESFARGEREQALSLCRSILAALPEHAGALSLLGIAMAQAGRMQEALELLRRAAARLPNEPSAHNNYGGALRDVGRLADALGCYERAIQLAPGYAEAHYNRALVLHDLQRFTDALASYDQALALKPDYAAAHNNRGSTLQELERYQDALTSYSRAIALKPDHAAAYNNRATAFLRIGRVERGLESAEKAIALRPDFAEAHNNRGIALQERKRFDDALSSYDRAITLRPTYAEAYNNRGTSQREMGQIDEALASFDRSLTLKHDYAEAHNNRGGILRARRRFADALASHERAIVLKPDFAEAHLSRGAVLHDLRRFHEALESFQRALAAKSQYGDAYRNQGLTLRELGRPEEALASYERALELSPEDGFLQGLCRQVKTQICDWTGQAADLERLSDAIDCGRGVSTPFAALSLFESPHVQRKVASIWARAECRPARMQPPLRRYPKHAKIRVGYFSADFRNHAVSALAAELFECHTRSQFELTAFALGPQTHDELRERVERAFDRFIPLCDRDNEQIAALARELEIDIAVDLGGYTQHAQPLIFAHRAAPIQVSYLGYLGTMGAGFMDYLIADEVIVPPGQRRFYAEKIAYLPSYQVNDSKRPVSDKVVTRAELGLPPSGFVFCCFNASYKIAPETFHSWMRILAAVPEATLLLLADNLTTRQNLRREAVNSGINPDRLVFAGRVPYGDYMARHRATDLFLDTHPYNAGTTASDALWMGLPVLTYAGDAFAARVAASVLTSVGLPQLIATDRAGYERLAIELANSPDRLQEIKRALAAARGDAALFDTPRFARNLESLFRRMYERHHLGLLPEHLALEGPAR